jgi:hypothetical protein
MWVIGIEEPLAVAVIGAIRNGDQQMLSRLLSENPGLATARIGGDPSACEDGGMTR